MRYSTALVLSTLAVGQAAAGNIRHASFHARRQADAKRTDAKRGGDYDNVNWEALAYDFSGVDWSTVDYGNPTPTPTPAPAPAPAPVDSKPAPVEEPKTSATPTPEHTPEKKPDPAPTSEEAPKPSQTESSDPIGDIISDLTHGVEAMSKRLGFLAGVNDQSDNGGIWIGESSPYKVQFINDHSKDAVLYCWRSQGFDGMSLNKHQPAAAVGLKPGDKTVLSWAAGVPSACSVAYDDTPVNWLVDNTWVEFNFGQWGTFDVSRNVRMDGNNISAKGSKCSSTMDSCVFKCTGGVNTCEKGYELAAMDAPGCGGGYDANMAGTGGGCSMNPDSETVVVTFS